MSAIWSDTPATGAEGWEPEAWEPAPPAPGTSSPFAEDVAAASLDDGVAEWEADDLVAEHLVEAESETLAAPFWQPIVRIAMAGGVRDPNKLTNLVFFARHPERQGRKLTPDERDFASLSVEWRRIRDAIVGPVAGTAPWPGRHGSTATTTTGAVGPLTAVATPLPSGATANRYGIPETIEALEWIGSEWARRRPEVRFGVRDISRRGGGRLRPHKSHRVGLDADVNLVVNGRRIGVANADYGRQRPLVQELVDLVRSNPVLPVKTIGFLDRQVRGVEPWPGHTRHLHIRFCRPERYASQLDPGHVYAAGEPTPDYTCDAAREHEDDLRDLYYEDELEDGDEFEDVDELEDGDEFEDRDAPVVAPQAGKLASDDPVADTIAGFAADQLRHPGEEAEGFLEPLRRLAEPFRPAFAVVRALHGGAHDEDALTDAAFRARFPAHHGGRPTSGDPQFAIWSTMRESLVRPLLWGHIRTEARRIGLAEWEWWRRGRRVEDEPGVQGRLTDYWAVTPHMPVGAAIWQESWSAAFISWVLHEAGTGTNFRYDNAHRVFVHWAIRNAVDRTAHPVTAHPVVGADRIAPRVGDLVCTWRGTVQTTYAELAGMAQPPHRALHCDLVTDVAPPHDPGHIWVVGGNKTPAAGVICPVNPMPPPNGCTAAEAANRECGCTVNRARHRLAPDGFLAPNRRWVAIVRLGP